MKTSRLRVAFVAGTLGKGGAEKQLVLMVKALRRADVDVRVYCATAGEHYESALRDLGCDPVWFGQRHNPASRLSKLTLQLRGFHPHIIQSAHFYTNLYAALSARALRTIGFGGIRNDAVHEVEANGRWGRWLIRLPKRMIANSHAARDNAAGYGVDLDRVHVLPNVIDLEDFDRRASRVRCDGAIQPSSCPTAFAVGRLVRAKRMDRFLDALAGSNQQADLRGVIVGDGPERANLEAYSRSIGLAPDKIKFLGWRDDLPQLFRNAEMLVISSDHEGFPNVLLESMASRLPAIGTPAGEVANVIQDGVTGFVVPMDDPAAMVAAMVRLARQQELRETLGNAARRRAEQSFSCQSLYPRLLQIYSDAMGRRASTIEQLAVA